MPVTSPSSSTIIGNIKSVWASGKYKYFCVELPKPTPNKPPLLIAIKPLQTWYPVVSVYLEHGFLKLSLPFWILLKKLFPEYKMARPAIIHPTAIILINFIILFWTIGILINVRNTIPAIIAALPKSGCINTSPIIINANASGTKYAYIFLTFL